MAKGNLGDILIYGVVGYAAYELARNDKLGATAKQLADQIHDSLNLGTPTAKLPGTTPGTTTGTTPTPTTGSCPQFIQGERYVSATGDGRFVVVIDGQPKYYSSDQHDAERWYNHYFGC